MTSDAQKTVLLQKLRKYRQKYLVKKFKELDESATRIMVNNLLIDVLGYKELEEVKTEYAIKGAYADYVVQVERKKHFVVEVKAIQIDLSEKHLRQAVGYAANEGIDWILLANGRCYELYRVIFGKPITWRKVCSFDLNDQAHLKTAVDCLSYLTRRNAMTGNLEKFWKRFQALDPKNIAKIMHSIEVVKFLRKRLKKDVKILFPEEEIYESLHQVIINKIDMPKPKFSAAKRYKKMEPEPIVVPANTVLTAPPAIEAETL
jgi:hypothetical protein